MSQSEKLSKEDEKLIPIIIKILSKTSKNHTIYGKEIVKGIVDRKSKLEIKSFSEIRLRKIVNYLRVYQILPVITNKDGYFVSYDKEDIIEMCVSLDSRAESIKAAADGLRMIAVNEKLPKNNDLWDFLDKNDNVL